MKNNGRAEFLKKGAAWLLAGGIFIPRRLTAGPIINQYSFLSIPATTVGITPGTLGTLRSDATACVGLQFSVLTVPRTVYYLGRWVVSGNSSTHVVSLRDSSGSVLGSVTLNTSGATAGQFLYGLLSTPVVITNGLTYHLWTQETNAGDQWYDLTPVTVTADFNSPIASYSLTCSTPSLDQNNKSYGPVNFKYA
jgi:hypothetical protein